ncbi:Gfo/Idh/MocA family protein [Salinibacterium soli]|uniref:Gfo/Idh/MocA family oxidoreductase n=1 Tax=Antiquaquibacter soli TaxID=3064523 RepID=A0ABT9BJH1_9MICO|nr:Gfo/Idh/MocA family oxidoreductase [Protaetiibacter sp. WY-16]MDO7881166.1 Gfo/Idh/MocA family oxidoreductase [Protaetiibacter sp. WY-16]
MSVRVGVIGAGAFGREHALAYSQLPTARLVSIVDADPARADSLAAELGVDRGGALGHPDAVSVVVPAASRGTLVADSIAAGRAVLIEKPLAATVEEAREIVRLGGGLPVMVGHLLRFAEPYVRLEQRARAFGRLSGGTLGRLRSAAHAARHPADDVVGLTMIHDLDAVAWLAGSSIATVRATGRADDERWIASDAELTMADGSRWFVHAAWEGSDADQRDDASIVAADGRESSLSLGSADAAVYDSALEAELAHFVECAALGAPSDRLVLADAARAVAAADAVRTSMEQKGAPVDVW